MYSTILASPVTAITGILGQTPGGHREQVAPMMPDLWEVNPVPPEESQQRMCLHARKTRRHRNPTDRDPGHADLALYQTSANYTQSIGDQEHSTPHRSCPRNSGPTKERHRGNWRTTVLIQFGGLLATGPIIGLPIPQESKFKRR